jgi:uncharacterized protein YraI
MEISMAWCKHERDSGQQLRPLGAVAGGAVVIATFAMLVLPASAEPAAVVSDRATAVAYPAGAAATRYFGLAFDTCTAPPLAAINAWGASRYHAIAVYIGGVNRACRQPELTASWVTAVSKRKWRLLPVYVGLQPPCVIWNRPRKRPQTRAVKPSAEKIGPSAAASQGTAAADDAAAEAKALGLGYGSALYDDIENYARNDGACRSIVLGFVSAWTKELHRLGYLAGVYVSLSSGAPDLSSVYTSTSFGRPDALWIAWWDQNPSLTGWAGISSSQWSVHQRAKQYRSPHNETHGGVAINIDSDNLDVPVATVAYGYTVTSTSGLYARTGPSTAYPIARTYAYGSMLPVVCQAPGSTVATTRVWDKLSDGTYVTDFYVSTPSNTGYSAPLPGCVYPYQVTDSAGLNERTGPGTSYPIAGVLTQGGFAWVVCQEPGAAVGTTSVWDKLQDSHWVTDYNVATPSKTTYSGPAPRC